MIEMNKTEFIQDVENFTLTAKRSFSASQHRVWEAFTTPTLLEQWFAPEPFRATTVSMDFQVGGAWHYCMNGPDGEKHYGLTKYLEINPESYIRAEDYFVDADAKINTDLPGMIFENSFTADGDKTHLLSVVTFTSLENLKTVLEMGMQEGYGASLDQLEGLLASMNEPITVEITVDAPVERVWECWNGPEHVSGWAFASDDWGATPVTNDLTEGGSFKTTMFAKDGSMSFDFEGTYTEVVEHERIAYDLTDGRHVTVVFDDTPDGVYISQTFEPEDENPREMQEGGWQAFLTNFKNYVESA